MVVPMTGAIDQIRDVIARYCQLCDDGRFDEWAELFTPDTRFHVMGRTSEGRAAAQAFIEAGQTPERRGKHLAVNTVIELDQPDVVGTAPRSARAWTDYIFVSRDKAITSVGRYHDVLVRDDDGRWRFAVREIVFLGDSPEITGLP